MSDFFQPRKQKAGPVISRDDVTESAEKKYDRRIKVNGFSAQNMDRLHTLQNEYGTEAKLLENV